MRILFTVMLPFTFYLLHAQQLIVNGDFEDENICTEYGVNCAPEAWVSTTNGFNNYMKDSLGAFSGTHYMGIDAGSSKVITRTYICSQLVCHLRKGNTYNISLYARSKYPILDSFAVYFTRYHFYFERSLPSHISPEL